jgi:hypothetical protein
VQRLDLFPFDGLTPGTYEVRSTRNGELASTTTFSRSQRGWRGAQDRTGDVRANVRAARIPAALILIITVVFIFLPRSGEEEPTRRRSDDPPALEPRPRPPGLAAVTATEAATPQPTLTLAPTPAPTPTATPVADSFQAEVLACRLIAGSNCIGRLGVLPARAGAFTALVRFSDARAGDAISVALAGPGGTIDRGPYTLQGGGDGYYYSTFTIGGLPDGEYTLVATRNGTEVAQTSFQRGR